MADDKEAVEAVARVLCWKNGMNPDVTLGGDGVNFLWHEYIPQAEAALAAARPFHFEEAARDAIERAEIYEQSTTANTPGYKDAAIALRAFAAAIRAAKEMGE